MPTDPVNQARHASPAAPQEAPASPASASQAAIDPAPTATPATTSVDNPLHGDDSIAINIAHPDIDSGKPSSPAPAVEPVESAEPLETVAAAIDYAAALAEAQAALAQAQAALSEQKDACLRARAETENVRRRAHEEVSKASKFASEKFATAILPVKDALEAALATSNQSAEKIREGVELTLKQLVSVFDAANVREENPENQKFDPNKHQAVGALESDTEPNTVVTVLQKGYLLHERVIRPAMVMVARARVKPEAGTKT